MSGALIGGVIGGVIGFFAGGNVALGFMIGSAIGGAYDYSQIPDTIGPRLQDRTMQLSSYGAQIPLAFGSVRLAGNVIWPANFNVTEHESSESSKGGPETVSFSYSATFAVLLCEGPIEGIGRIWMNKKLMYDPNAMPTTDGAIAGMTFYYGTEAQEPDPLMVAADGSAPAYRGWAYIVFEDLELTSSGFGNRLPSVEVEINAPVTVPVCPPKPSRGVLSVFANSATSSDYNSGILVYTESGNEFWMVFGAVGASYGIHRYDGTTAAFKGLISLPSGGIDPIPDYLVYDPFFNKVWGIASRTIMRYDCATNLEDLRVVHGTDPWGGVTDVLNVPLTVDRLNGTPWIATKYDNMGAGTAWIFKMNPTTGAIANSWVVDTFGSGSGYSAPADYPVIDNNGDCWYLAGSAALKRVNAGSPQTSTDFYAGGGSRFTAITYDSGRHCMWIAVAIDNPDTVINVNINWAFKRYNIALNAIDITISGQRNFYHCFEFDAVRDLLWVEEYYAAKRISAFCGATGARIHRKTQSYTTGYSGAMTAALVPETVGLLAGIGRYDFVFRKTGNNVFYIAKASTLVGYPVIRYSWDQPLIPTAVTPTPQTLGAIVSALSTRVPFGLDTADIDVTALTDIVDGYLIGQQMTRRQAIEPLMASYFFDAVESDHKIKYVKRGAASAVTIAQDDRAAHLDGEEMPPHLAIQRVSELELPWSIDVSYIEKARDYQVGDQYDRRITRNANDPRRLELAIVMTAAKAKQVAMVNLYLPWLRTRFGFSTTVAYAKYEPSDVVTLPTENVTYNARIISRSDQGNGIIQWEAELEDSAIYTQTGTVSTTRFAPQTIADPGATDLELLDVPILRDADDNAGYYAAMGGETAAWPGAQLHRSADGGATFEPTLSIVTAATMGDVIGTLGTFTAGNIFDNGNSITVVLTSGGPLTSATETQVLNGTNTAVIGTPGLWEVVNFKNAVLTAANTYLLSGFLRGRRGTEWLVGSHGTGDKFILSSVNTWRRINPGSADLGLVRLFRAPPFGTLLSNSEVELFTNTGVGLKPYAPVDLAATRDGVGNLTLTWRRRSRIGYGTLNAAVPLGEAVESYSVDVMDGAVVKRTIASATQTAAYSAAQQVTDFGSAQASVTVNVYQISATVARGYALNGTI